MIFLNERLEVCPAAEGDTNVTRIRVGLVDQRHGGIDGAVVVICDTESCADAEAGELIGAFLRREGIVNVKDPSIRECVETPLIAAEAGLFGDADQ